MADDDSLLSIEELRSDLAEVKSMLEESEATINEYEAINDETQKEVDRLEEECNTWRQKAERALSSSGASSDADVKRIAILESHAARFKRDAEAAAAKLRAVEQTNDDLERALRGEKGQHATLQEELEEAITTNEVLEETMDGLREEHSEEIHRLREQLEASSSSSPMLPAPSSSAAAVPAVDFDTELVELRQTVDQLNDELDEERDGVADLENQVTELSVDLDQSQEAMLSLQETVESLRSEMDVVNEQLVATRAALDAERAAHGELGQRHEEKHASHATLEMQLRTTRRELGEKSRVHDAQKNETRKVEKMLAEREAEVQQLRKARDRDAQQVEELTAHVEEASATLVAKNTHIRNLEAAQAKADAAPSMNASAQTLRDEVQLLRTKLVERDAAAARVVEQLTEEISVLHGDDDGVAQLRVRIKSLREDKVKLTRRLRKMIVAERGRRAKLASSVASKRSSASSPKTPRNGGKESKTALASQQQRRSPSRSPLGDESMFLDSPQSVPASTPRVRVPAAAAAASPPPVPRDDGDDDVEDIMPTLMAKRSGCDEAVRELRGVASKLGDVGDFSMESVLDEMACIPPKAEQTGATSSLARTRALRDDLDLLRRTSKRALALFGDTLGATAKALPALLEWNTLSAKAMKRDVDALRSERKGFRVLLRVRPTLSDGERKSGLAVQDLDKSSCAFRDSTEKLRGSYAASAGGSSEGSAGAWRAFAFDRVFGPAAGQRDVYAEIEDLAPRVARGGHAALVAYGQTGSGKTFSMQGVKSRPGISARLLRRLSNLVNAKGPTSTLSLAMLEIYNESVLDLLSGARGGAAGGSSSSGGGSTPLDMRWVAGAVTVPGLTWRKVTNIAGALDILAEGNSHRATAATNVHEHSSRSHLVMLAEIDRVSDTGAFLFCFCFVCFATHNYSITNARLQLSLPLSAPLGDSGGLLFLVDLAGSERVANTAASGQRLQEARHINRSLSALGDVLMALDRKQSHVPYRNSKLTQLLSSALGGEAQTVMLLTVCPHIRVASETLCSLKFGARVRNIDLGPAVAKATVANLKSKCARLTSQLTRQRSLTTKMEVRRLVVCGHGL